MVKFSCIVCYNKVGVLERERESGSWKKKLSIVLYWDEWLCKVMINPTGKTEKKKFVFFFPLSTGTTTDQYVDDGEKMRKVGGGSRCKSNGGGGSGRGGGGGLKRR